MKIFTVPYLHFTFPEKRTFGANWRLSEYISVHLSSGFMISFLPCSPTSLSTYPHQPLLLSPFGTRWNNSHDSSSEMKWGRGVDNQTESWRKASVLHIWIAFEWETVISVGENGQRGCVCYNFVCKTRGPSVSMGTSYFSNTLFLLKYYHVLCFVDFGVSRSSVSPLVSMEKSRTFSVRDIYCM